MININALAFPRDLMPLDNTAITTTQANRRQSANSHLTFPKNSRPSDIANNDSLNKEKAENNMGHIAHLRKQFKSINTYEYIIRLIRGKKYY